MKRSKSAGKQGCLSPDQRVGDDGRYRVVDLIGQGGMGQVYRAYDERLDRYVAIKVLYALKELAQEKRSRFRREAKLSAKLRHPNLVPVYDSIFTEERDLFVQEFVEGEDLDHFIEAGKRLNADEGRRLLREMAGALSCLHEKGIVHRDIKPGNILIDIKGPFRLMDFGLAHDPESTRLTTEGSIIGTMLYMPPEITLGSSSSEASDVYQLGLAVHLALTGQSLHKTPQTPQEFNEILTAGFKRRAISKEIPKDLRKVIALCCKQDPRARPANGSEVLELIDSIKDKRPKDFDDSSLDLEEHRTKRVPHFRSGEDSELLGTPTYALPLIIALAIVSGALILVFSQGKEQSSKGEELFELCSVELRLPRKMVFLFPFGTLQKSYGRIEDPRQGDEDIPAIRSNRGWRLTVPRPKKSNEIRLSLHSWDGRKSSKKLKFPETPFLEAPKACFGLRDFSLQWKVHGNAGLDLELGLIDSGKELCRGSSLHGNFAAQLPRSMHGRKVRWTLSFANSILDEGVGTLGLNKRFSLKKGSMTPKSIDQYLLWAEPFDKGLHLAATGGFVSLEPTYRAGLRELEELYRIDLGQVREHSLLSMSVSEGKSFLGSMSSGSQSMFCFCQGRKKKCRVYGKGVSQFYALPLIRNLTFCISEGKDGVTEAILIEKGRIVDSKIFEGQRILALRKHRGTPLAFVLRNEQVRTLGFSIENQSIKVVESKDYEIRICPILRRGSCFDPARIQLTAAVEDKIFLAHEDRLYSIDLRGGSEEIALSLPKDSHIKQLIPKDEEGKELFILVLSPCLGISGNASDISRLCLLRIEQSTDGQWRKSPMRTLAPSVFKESKRGKAFGMLFPGPLLYVASKGLFLAVELRAAPQVIFKDFRLSRSFCREFFYIDGTIYLPEHEGSIYGFEHFDI